MGEVRVALQQEIADLSSDDDEVLRQYRNALRENRQIDADQIMKEALNAYAQAPRWRFWRDSEASNTLLGLAALDVKNVTDGSTARLVTIIESVRKPVAQEIASLFVQNPIPATHEGNIRKIMVSTSLGQHGIVPRWEAIGDKSGAKLATVKGVIEQLRESGALLGLVGDHPGAHFDRLLEMSRKAQLTNA